MKNKLAYTISRILLGLSFVFFGVGKFMLPTQNPGFPDAAWSFFAAMIATGYMMPAVGVIQIAVGLMLLANLWVPFAMILLAPIMVNIILFNAFLAKDPMGVVFVGIPLLLQVYIMYCTWDAYKPLFAKVQVKKK